jgi:hypothetical protein
MCNKLLDSDLECLVITLIANRSSKSIHQVFSSNNVDPAIDRNGNFGRRLVILNRITIRRSDGERRLLKNIAAGHRRKPTRVSHS